MEKLKEAFPLHAHEFKPTALTSDKSRGLGLVYVDPRWYQHRLDQADPEWKDEMDPTEVGERLLVTCHLTVNGVTRTEIGECTLDDKNGGTIATAQAFKRACVKFGLGRYLYFMPKVWAEYDSNKKRFTEAGMKKLRTALKKVLNKRNRDK